MEIDTNWCGCGRAIQSPASGSYCSPACEAKERSHSITVPRFRPTRVGAPSGLDLDREDRSAPLYGRSTHFSIDRWRHQIRPLEGVDAKCSAGSPASSSALSLASSQPLASSSSALPAWPSSPSYAALPLPLRRPLPTPAMDCLPSLYNESLSPPQTAALTTDEESIPTPPGRSEVDHPLAIYSPETRSPGLFNRLRNLTQSIVSSPKPAIVSASFDEAVSRSPGRHKHECVRTHHHQPAVAIPIPARQSPAHKGHYIYRPSSDLVDDDLDSEPSFRAAPIVSRARPLF